MSEGRVDVVTGPVRYRVTPFIALFAILLVPVAALTALVVWSDGQADEHESALATTPDDSGEPAPPPVSAAPKMTTGLLSYRRLPNQMVAAGDDARLSEAMNELASFVDDRSCLSVSVDGRPVIGHNADVPVIPASTHKLLVAAVALEVLGPDHVFTTSVSAPPAVDGVIDGDLVLVGGGDPLLLADDSRTASDSLPAFNTTSLDQLADAVVAAGVTTVNGSVLGDGGRYDDEFVIPSWGPGVAFTEAGPTDALVVNDARVVGRSGRQRDPNEAAAREFARLLGERDVRISRGFGAGSADPAQPILASIESQPLTAVLAELLTTSDNDTAEMLLKELGVADAGEGTVAAGLNVIDRTLRSAGVPMEGVRLVDASGLSSDNRLTCAALIAVLRLVEDGPIADALPVAGRTGTLADQFVGTPMEGRLTAKTGTLGNAPVELDPPAVKGLAGFLETTEGGIIEFAMILNGPDIANPDKFAPYWGAFAERLATYPNGPDPTTVGPR
ncbi:MAG TPA: D-alanyl-D-alanine carboxypeptidase/D-alanyl-D-alanine-endopeptidase [Ilumatobacteraceae bacterium]|nr:D-alanyl-D-alanine carboxypeptidase/D-alanyl-D-alanine-endopeptidase [Ilumatobacteraceae bacterium]